MLAGITILVERRITRPPDDRDDARLHAVIIVSRSDGASLVGCGSLMLLDVPVLWRWEPRDTNPAAKTRI